MSEQKTSQTRQPLSTASRPWFRFYAEALNDPKVQLLEPSMFKGWVNLLCLGSAANGALPSLDEIAFKLRLSQHSVRDLVDHLVLVGLVDIAPNGSLKLHNWEARQFVSDTSRERVKKHRQNKRKRRCNVTVTADVTTPEADTDTESDKKAAAAASANPTIFEIEKAVWSVAEFAMQHDHQDPSVLQEWIDAGCDLHLDILPTVAAIASRQGFHSIGSYRYFSNAVLKARGERLSGAPPSSPEAAAARWYAQFQEAEDEVS